MSVRIAVLFGGRSGEHDVSVASATSIIGHLDRDRYEVTRVLMGRDGRWWVDDTETSVGQALDRLAQQQVVLPALHGPYGEDGTVQAMLELLGVRYVGNRVLASAVGMDKDFTKKLLRADGLRVAGGVLLHPGAELTPAQRRLLRLPVFVKPARAGSSLGVSRVDDWTDLPAALRLARDSDQKVLIESEVRGREIDVAVLEHPDGRVEAGPPLEIAVARGAFFDYAAKYAGGASLQIPADLDAATTRLLQDRAVQAFHALDCRGLLRVDFFLPEPGANDSGQDGGIGWIGDPGEPVINEVNTFPGFTAQSQYPRIWQQAGLAFGDLLDILITGALEYQHPLAGALGQTPTH